MPADLVISSSRVVTPRGVGPAAVAITAGVIGAVTEPSQAPDAARRLDVGSAALLPGVVDSHVHVNEPGRAEWEGFETASRAAAAGGVTTIVDMPLNSVPVTTSVDALERKAQAAAGHATVDYAFWGGVVPGNGADLAPLARAGARGFKAFLVPSGIDEFPAVAESDLRDAMRRIAPLGLPLLVHAELPGPIAQAMPPAGSDPRRYSTYLGSRPAAAEQEAVGLVLRVCRETSCRVHIVHVSAAATLEAVQGARRAGLPVTAETCPHYLTFAAEEIVDGGTAWKCAPPIRDRATRERLWGGLADGALDLVASDHSPAPASLKCIESGDFLRAWGGVASLELSLAATWTGARARGHDLGEMARWMAAAPARLAGLGRKGRIAPGCDADLVVFDPEAPFTVETTRLRQRHPITPYAGMMLWGVVRQTFVRGLCVYENGAFPGGMRGTWCTKG